jgi:hypothetical protein
MNADTKRVSAIICLRPNQAEEFGGNSAGPVLFKCLWLSIVKKQLTRYEPPKKV